MAERVPHNVEGGFKQTRQVRRLALDQAFREHHDIFGEPDTTRSPVTTAVIALGASLGIAKRQPDKQRQTHLQLPTRLNIKL
jgi:hypothetical protein